MRAVLEICSEIQFGHKRAIRAGQVLEVGRSSIVDFCVEADESMSGRHFQIRTDSQGCYLEDLGSANGTSVNGTPVTAPIVLRDADRIVAGTTSFQIQLSGVDPSVNVAPIPASLTLTESEVASRTIWHEQLDNDLYLSKGKASGRVVAEFLTGLVASGDEKSIAVIVDRTKDRFVTVLGEHDGERLFQWLPEESTPTTAPRVYNLDVETAVSIITAAWGTDALVVVLWESADESPLAQLCRCAGAFVRPSLVHSSFTVCPIAAAKDMMIGLRGVLAECDDGDGWSYYSLIDDSESFRALGFEVESESVPMSDED